MGTDEDNVQRLKDVMFSQEVLRTAWKEIIGTSVHMNISVIETPRDIGGLQTARVKVVVSLWSEEKPAAEELLETYIEKLKGELSKENNFARGLYFNKHQQYAQRTNDAENHLQNLLSQQNNLGGRGMLDKESVRQRILEHEKAKIENNMQQAILQKRAEELVKQIEEAHRTTDEIASIRDAILGLMSDRDRLRTEYKEIDFKRKQYAENDPGGSHEKIVELTSKLSELETNINHVKREIDKLSKREQQLESQTAGDIQELNRQLRETTMQLEELNIQEAVLAGYSPGNISDSIEYEMLEVHIEAAKENLRRALIEMREFQLQIDLLQSPIVSYDKIISSETPPKPKDD
ncbi:MAG: GumC domain-containing protein [Planctomycetota bacterium]|jgi:chromosome segregation ATPase